MSAVTQHSAGVLAAAWEILSRPIRQPHLCTKEHPCGTCRRLLAENADIIESRTHAGEMEKLLRAIKEAGFIKRGWWEKLDAVLAQLDKEAGR